MCGGKTLCRCLAASLVMLAWAPLVPRDAFAARHVAVMQYGGPIDKAAAETAAKASARRSAAQDALRSIVARHDVRFAARVDSHADVPPDPLGLAYAVIKIQPGDISFKDLADGSGAVSVVLDAQTPVESAAVRAALLNPERVQLYTYAAMREQQLLAQFSIYSAAVGTAQEPGSAAVAQLCNSMAALSLYLDILPFLEKSWLRPFDVLAAMQSAVKLDPDNPLLHSALGDACMLLSRPHEAREAQTRALRLDAQFVRAYHGRGIACLALRLPLLALADLSEAIRLAPFTAAYRRDRAAAWLLLEKNDDMCADLYEACALGECEQYKWAVGQGSCEKKIPEYLN